MRALCVAAAVALVLCVACADAVSPHRAMKARGPVSPFPIEPTGAPARARKPMPPAAAGAPGAKPQLSGADAAAEKKALQAVEQLMVQYFRAWSSVSADHFDTAPAMKLYAEGAAFNDAVHQHSEELKRGEHIGELKFHGANSKTQYAAAIGKLYNGVSHISRRALGGQPKLTYNTALWHNGKPTPTVVAEGQFLIDVTRRGGHPEKGDARGVVGVLRLLITEQRGGWQIHTEDLTHYVSKRP